MLWHILLNWSDPKFVRTMILNPLVYPLSKSILPNNLETYCWCLCSGFVFLVPILLLRSKYDFFFVSCWTNYKLVRMNAGEICINDCRCRISKGWVWKPCWRSGCYPFRVKSLVLILESSTVLKSHHHVLCAILDSEFKAFFFPPDLAPQSVITVGKYLFLLVYKLSKPGYTHE